MRYSLSYSMSQCFYSTLVIQFCVLLHIAASAVIPKSNSTLLQNDAGCTKSADWLGHSLPNEEDCAATIHKLYRVELLRHGMNKFEFIGKGASRETKLPAMPTPRRYTVGKCTLVLAMLDVFPDGDLPNAPKGPMYGTDVASFRDIESLAVNINLNCVVFRHSAGYRVTGEWDSLGIFMLSTESYQNRIIPSGVRPELSAAFDLPNVLNGSDHSVATA